MEFKQPPIETSGAGIADTPAPNTVPDISQPTDLPQTGRDGAQSCDGFPDTQPRDVHPDMTPPSGRRPAEDIAAILGAGILDPDARSVFVRYAAEAISDRAGVEQNPFEDSSTAEATADATPARENNLETLETRRIFDKYARMATELPGELEALATEPPAVEAVVEHSGATATGQTAEVDIEDVARVPEVAGDTDALLEHFETAYTEFIDGPSAAEQLEQVTALTESERAVPEDLTVQGSHSVEEGLADVVRSMQRLAEPGSPVDDTLRGRVRDWLEAQTRRGEPGRAADPER